MSLSVKNANADKNSSDTSKSDLGETPMSGANSVSSTAALFGALIAV